MKSKFSLDFPLIKVDYAFKYVMARKRNKPVLKSFLEAVLKKSIKDFEIKDYEDTHLHKSSADDKLGILDLLVTFTDGTIVNVEMQLHYNKHLLNRITFYVTKLVSRQLESGQGYDMLKPVISILIANENVFDESIAYHHTFHLYDSANNVKFTDLLEIHTLELQKLPEAPEPDAMYRWVQFFKADSREEMEAVAAQDEDILKAYAELARMAENEDEKLAYERRMMAIWDERALIETHYERGLEAGVQQGIKTGEQIQKQVFKMLRDNKTAEEIKSMTGISDANLANYQADFEELFL